MILIYFLEAFIKLGKAKKQTRTNDVCDKEAQARTVQFMARCFYKSGTPFNVLRNKNLKLMVEAIGNYGPHLKIPSYHEM